MKLAIDKTRNMEHPGTSNNYDNYDNYEKNMLELNFFKNKINNTKVSARKI